MSGWAGLAGLLLAVAGAQEQQQLLLLQSPRAPRNSVSAAAKEAAEFDRTYAGTVSRVAEQLYSFNYTTKPGQVDAVRVNVRSDSENLQYPVLFVVRQQKGVLSWQVPLVFRGLYQSSYKYTEVSRTLCPSEESGPSEQILFIDVASMAPYNAHYVLQVTRIKNFQLKMGAAFNFTASPSQPQASARLILQYFQSIGDITVLVLFTSHLSSMWGLKAVYAQEYFLYKFPPDVDSVMVRVVSETVYPCSVVSIQDIVCPVYDLDHNVEFNGVYQSMTKQAAITVQKKDFPSKQFFIVFVIKPEDYACGGSMPASVQGTANSTLLHKRIKTFEVTVTPSVKGSWQFCLRACHPFQLSELLLILSGCTAGGICAVYQVGEAFQVQQTEGKPLSHRKTSAGGHSPNDGNILAQSAITAEETSWVIVSSLLLTAEIL
ncbi:SID1 transmembrane family member 1 [Varanus komodoensis]|nr:SID1 transmembrane family member 1 [Varanus komodoensis]